MITEFTKNELQIMGNCMWFINNLISSLSIMVTISQVDIAILKVIYSELTTVYTIRMLLNEKTFINENNNNSEHSNENDNNNSENSNENDNNNNSEHSDENININLIQMV